MELFENAVKGLNGWHGNGGHYQRSISLETDLTDLLKQYESLAKEVLTKIASMSDASEAFQRNVKKALVEVCE